MGQSFRLRMIVLSVGVSGLVLAVFAFAAWAFVHRIGLRDIDRRMARRIGPIVAVSHQPEHWSWIADGLELSYGEEGCVVLVKGLGGQILELSEDWPERLSSDDFPAPDPADPRLIRLPPPAPPAALPQPPPGTSGAVERPPMAPPLWTFLPVTPPEFVTRRTRAGNWRLCTMHNTEVTLVMGVSLARFGGEMGRVRTAFLAALPAALLFIAVGSWLVSRRALRSVENLADVAEQVTASSLDQRIPSEGVEAEFRRLIAVLNGMLDRLERSFDQAVRFSADAAHELQTPLTILQGEIEQALQTPLSAADQQRLHGDLLEEVHRLKTITRKLLLLSKADSGQLRPALDRLDLSQMVLEAAEDVRTFAPSLTATSDVAPGVVVLADRDLLHQALGNLSSNAMKYNRDDGSVEFKLTTGDGMAEVTIANTGPGIPPQDVGRLFHRFHRADRSRGRRVDGVGLGLSLAREIARAHGGDVALVETCEGRTVFRMAVPTADYLPKDDDGTSVQGQARDHEYSRGRPP